MGIYSIPLCQALELGHGGLFTVETLFAQLLDENKGWPNAMWLLLYRGKRHRLNCGLPRFRPECCDGSAPVERAGFKRIL